jgi:predicted amidohydrolase
VEDFRIAAAQITCTAGKASPNLEKHKEYVYRAAQQGARLVCFPELSLSGYPNGDSLPHDLAQPLEGQSVQTIVEVSKGTGMIILAGLLERDQSGVIYNTHVVIGPKGLIGAYRKTHVANSEIHRFYHGHDLPVFNLGHLTFGLQICYDNHFPEASRVLALKGAEVIFAAYASPGPNSLEGLSAKRNRWLRYLPARAFDNSVYVVAVNQVGKSSTEEQQNGESSPGSTARDTHSGMAEFPGGSLAINPWGEVIAEAQPLVEDLMVVDLTQAALEEKRRDALQFFTHFRRPELYDELIRKSFPRHGAMNSTAV